MTGIKRPLVQDLPYSSTPCSIADPIEAGGIHLRAVVSPSWSSQQDNYDAGFAFAIRANVGAPCNLTGIEASTSHGRRLLIINAGSASLTLKSESGSSADANRFALSADLVLAAGNSTELWYDETSTRWRVVSAPSTGGGGGGGGSDRSAVTALSITSGNVTVDCAAGDYFTLALTENVTGWTIDNLPGAGFGAELQILITQESIARTVAWPDEWRWEDDTPPSVSTGDGVSDVLRLTYFGVAGIAAYLSKGRTEMIVAGGGGGFADYAEYATWADAQTVGNSESIANLSAGFYVGYESGGGSLTGGMGAGIYRLSIADCDFVLSPFALMWGSPSSADQYVTYDSGLGAWLVHVFEGSASTGSNQPNKIIVSFDDQSSHTTTGVTKNGYTSLSYSAWTSLRTEYVIYWDYNLGKARRYNAATNTYSDFSP